VTFPDSTDYGDLDSFSSDKIFAYPVYRVYIAEDEEQFNVTNWAPPTLATTYAGPVRSGTVRFVQYDVR
jgi:hypothetical protein